MSTNMAPSGVDLRTYLRVLRRRKWWVIVCTGLALAGAIAYSFSAPKKYSATAQLLVQPQSGTLPLNTPAQSITPTQVLTELQLLSSAPVVDAVKSRLHLSQLNVASAEQGLTDVISITATNRDPVLAARVANTYARQFVDYQTFVTLKGLTTAELELQSQINAIDQELPLVNGTPQGVALANQVAVLKEEYAQYQVDGAATTGGVTVTSSASVPKAPSSPKKLEISLIGLVVGLLVGLGAAFIAENLDDAIRSRDDLENVTPDVLIMGLVPMIGGWRDRDEPFLVMRAEPTSPAAEAYRSLRTSLQFATYDSEIASVLVTSPTATEGKTSTVANLGVVLATVGQHVVLVSADLRRPRLAAFFGLDEGVGLTSVMIGETTLDQALQAVPDIPGLAVLGCGPIPPNPAELLSRPKLAEIFDQLKEHFDIVLIDSSPLLPVTDPILLSRLSDTTLLVVASGHTTKRQLKRGVEQLAQVGTRHIGIVLNEVTRRGGDVYGEYDHSYTYGARKKSSVTPSSNGHADHQPPETRPAAGRLGRQVALD